jgi:hypothetical protein
MSNAITDIRNRTTLGQIMHKLSEHSFAQGCDFGNYSITKILEVLSSFAPRFLLRRAFHDPYPIAQLFPSKRDAPAKFGSWRFLLYPLLRSPGWGNEDRHRWENTASLG